MFLGRVAFHAGAQGTPVRRISVTHSPQVPLDGLAQEKGRTWMAELMMKEKTKETAAAGRATLTSTQASGCLRAGRVLQPWKKGLWGIGRGTFSLSVSSRLHVRPPCGVSGSLPCVAASLQLSLPVSHFQPGFGLALTSSPWTMPFILCFASWLPQGTQPAVLLSF